MKIAFHSNQLSLRGTEVAIYDYARYNEELLGNESIILAKDPNVWNYSHPLAIENFKKRFPVFFYKDFTEVEKILDNNNVDIFYAIKSGVKDGVVSKNRKSVNHVVFQNYQPHGDVYAYVSEWLGNKYKSPFVPHIVTLPDIDEDLRSELNIPKDAIVFGRHGGAETFDLLMAHKAIERVLRESKNIYFLFLYTNKFINHSRVIYLEGKQDLIYKTKFINTCDAMLHARSVGETFGLAVAEFSIKNKPVFTYGGSQRESAHLQMLGKNAFKYYSEDDLYEKLLSFPIIVNPDYNWNSYLDYNPEKVMKKFEEVFIK